MHEGFDGVAHKHGLVEDHLRDQLFRHVQQVGDHAFDAVDDFDGVGIAALLQDGNIDGGLAVDADLVVLDLRGIFRLPHIRHHH